MPSLGLSLLMLLAFLLPFEWETPLLTVGPIILTNVEMVLLLFLGVTGWHWRAWWQDLQQVPRFWLWLFFLFTISLFVTSGLAPEHQLNAFKASLRTITGLALATAVPLWVRQPRHYNQLVGALLLGGFIALVIGIGEAMWGRPFPWLTAVRPSATMLGPFLRLSGPFDYANQAAMYVEATLPLLLALSLTFRKQEALTKQWLLLTGVIVFVYLEAVLLTMSRAGLAVIIVSHVVVGFLLLLNRRSLYKLAWFSMAGLTLAFLATHLSFDSGYRIRLTSRDDSAWYQAQIEVPAELQVSAGETLTVSVTLDNNGAFTWHSLGPNPVHLAARWQAGEQILYRPMRWPLNQRIAPGQTAMVQVPLTAPPYDDQYQLFWDLVHEQRTWFAAKNGQQVVTKVTVNGGQVATERPEPFSHTGRTNAWDYRPAIPGRLTLWRIAAQLLPEQPLWGIGLDNYRLIYGRYLNQTEWNQTVHSNNWYIETLVSLGLLGSLPFFIWLGLLGYDIWQRITGRRWWLVSSEAASPTLAQMAVATSLIAYLLHGLVDYFLLFNPTGLLFWLLVGLWLQLRRGERGEDASGF